MPDLQLTNGVAAGKNPGGTTSGGFEDRDPPCHRRVAAPAQEVWISDRYSAQQKHGERHQTRLAHLARDTAFPLRTAET